jgi:hypothetical protein
LVCRRPLAGDRIRIGPKEPPTTPVRDAAN